MKAYSYTAYTAKGKNKNGVIIAETEVHASELLEGQGLFAAHISEKSKNRSLTLSRSSRTRLSADMRAVFTRQMAVLLAAGLAGEAALEAVRSSGTGSAIEHLAAQAKAAVLDGLPLSAALAQSDAGFPSYFIAAVRAAEISGDLAVVFEELATYLENAGTDRAQIITALIYPAFVAAVSLLICGILMVNVAPEIVAMFDVSGQQLPSLTVVVLGISDWIGANYIALIVGAVAAIISVVLALKITAVRNGLDNFWLRMPVIGRLIRLTATAQYLRTLALVIASRQTVLDGVASAADVLNIQKFRDQAEEVCEGVRSGESLSAALKHLTLIPPVALQLVNAGEKSAQIGKTTERAAALVENRLRNERKRIAALLDPMLMMIVGGFVLVIVLSILLPIFDLQSVVAQ